MGYNIVQSTRRPRQTANPAVQGLQQFSAPSIDANSSVSGRAAIEGLVRDIGRNLDMERKMPGGFGGYDPFTKGPVQLPKFQSGATPSDLEYFQGALEDSPSFGNQAINRQQGFEDNYQSAVRSGFRGMDPVASEAQYGRDLERYKMDAPVRQQQVAGQYGVQEQQEQSRGNLAQEQERSRGAIESARTGADILRGFLTSGQTPRSANIRGVGGVSFAPELRVPAGLARDLTAAVSALDAAKQRDSRFFGMGS